VALDHKIVKIKLYCVFYLLPEQTTKKDLSYRSFQTYITSLYNQHFIKGGLMTKVEELAKMISSRINSLTKSAAQLSRMAGASTCPRERRNLRDKSREARNKAALMQARLDKLKPYADDQELDLLSNGQ
jgi:hypothetical protein